MPPPPLLPPQRLRSVFAGFALDLLIAFVAMLLMSLLTGVIWGVYRVVRVAAEGGIDMQDAGALIQGIGIPSGAAMLWMSLFNTGFAACVPYFWRRRAGPAERAASHAAIRRPATWGWIIVTVVAVLGFSQGMTMLSTWFGTEPEPTNLAPIKDALTSSPVFAGVFIVLLAPAYEELLFRRVLFGRWWAAGRPWLGMLLSGAIFGCMHEIPGLGIATTLLWFTYVAMGAAFAWLYRRTGTLWASIMAHATNNAIALIALHFSTTL